jgi:phage terminase large subunit-like protein
MQHGGRAGHAIADFLDGRGEDPARWAERNFPRFRAKLAMRFVFDHLQADWMVNLLLATAPARLVASQIYFHQRGVASAG